MIHMSVDVGKKTRTFCKSEAKKKKNYIYAFLFMNHVDYGRISMKNTFFLFMNHVDYGHMIVPHLVRSA